MPVQLTVKETYFDQSVTTFLDADGTKAAGAHLIFTRLQFIHKM